MSPCPRRGVIFRDSRWSTVRDALPLSPFCPRTPTRAHFWARLACHELLAQRCGLQKGQVAHFKVEDLRRLTPTPDNRRRPIKQSSVESLAKSLVREGVLQPIVVRPQPDKDGWWEIRAGE